MMAWLIATLFLLTACGGGDESESVDTEGTSTTAQTTASTTAAPLPVAQTAPPTTATTAAPTTTTTTIAVTTTTVPSTSVVFYANCAAVRAAGKAPLRRGDPGYSSSLDRDGDGIACET